MVEQLKADLAQGLEASRGVPVWLLILMMFGLPGGSAVLTSRLTGGETTSAIEHLRTELKEEIHERKAFEAKCNSDRTKLDERLTQFSLDVSRQQILMEQVQGTQKTLLQQVSAFQDGMMRLVQSIDIKMRKWPERSDGVRDGS